MNVKLRQVTSPKSVGRVHVVEIPFRNNQDWEQWVLLRSDAHHDNPHCLQDWEKKHLDQALERNAGIIDNGDLFCAMQGKGDRRHAKDDVRPEHQCGNYLDALVRTAADFYEPYAKNWWMFGRGNHEMAVEKVHETDLTERLAATIKDRTGVSVPVGGYRGWFVFQFVGVDGNEMRFSKSLYYEHGSGGGGPVTKGTIQSNRRNAYTDGADILVTGHIHESWLLETPRQYLDRQFQWKIRECVHLQLPTYKQEFGANGYHNENCRPPKPLGAHWLRFYYADRNIRFEARRAPVHLD